VGKAGIVLACYKFMADGYLQYSRIASSAFHVTSIAISLLAYSFPWGLIEKSMLMGLGFVNFAQVLSL
jgi:hypothetical protein